MGHSIPTSVAPLITAFVSSLTDIDPDFVSGIYLTGSISLNDFQLNKSDVDFLVVCKLFPEKNLQIKLAEVHKKLRKVYKIPLNGFYITKDLLDIKGKKSKDFTIMEEN